MINKIGTGTFAESQGNSEVRDFQGSKRIKLISDPEKSDSFTYRRKKLREEDSFHKCLLSSHKGSVLGIQR